MNMSGTASTSLAIGSSRDGGYGGYRPPFTAGQWQELEHQALIYKYLVAGLPVPPDLVMPIRHSFDAISARLFHHPSCYASYYGKKLDPEPGRCRRTDGKKWRCSKDAHPDSKYCERHMHRGRNRSRKPVESQSTSQSLPTATPHVSSSSSTNTISFQSSGNGSFQNMPLYSTEGSSYAGNLSKLQMDNLSYGIDSKELRCIPGLTSETDDHTFASEASSGAGSLGLGFGAGTTNSWRLIPSQTSSSLLKPTQQNLAHAFDTMDSKQRQQQHCFLGNDVVPGKQEHNPVHPFFNEWPSMKESWSVDVDDGTDKNIFSSTQLSISIPRGSSDFSSGNAYSQNGEFPNSS